jgi:hypothetical protein
VKTQFEAVFGGFYKIPFDSFVGWIFLHHPRENSENSKKSLALDG